MPSVLACEWHLEHAESELCAVPSVHPSYFVKLLFTPHVAAGKATTASLGGGSTHFSHILFFPSFPSSGGSGRRVRQLHSPFSHSLPPFLQLFYPSRPNAGTGRILPGRAAAAQWASPIHYSHIPSHIFSPYSHSPPPLPPLNVGTGKTLLARAAAAECGASFLGINPSSVASKWFGDGVRFIRWAECNTMAHTVRSSLATNPSGAATTWFVGTAYASLEWAVC